MPAVPWQDWPAGTRVMVRVRLPAGESHLYTDVLGVIIDTPGQDLLLRTRDGSEVHVDPASIVAGKPIGPPPPRRNPRP